MPGSHRIAALALFFVVPAVAAQAPLHQRIDGAIAAATPDYFDFQRFSHGDFVGALAETLTAESVTRVLYPDDSTTQGQGLRFVQEFFLVACSVGDLIRRFRRANADWNLLPDKAAIQLNDTHPSMAVPELMRILLDEAKMSWDQAWELTRRTLAYTLSLIHI